MQRISAKLSRVEKLANEVFQYDFEYMDGHVDFQPGQFFMMEVPHEDPEKKVTRSYSVASAPSEKKFFSMCVKLIEGGKGSEFLRGLEIGAELGFVAPFGHFVLADSEKDVVMVATGTGVAPYMSMLTTLFERGFEGRVTLFFGVRSKEDLFYVDQLKQWEAEHENFKAVFTLSRPSDDWDGATGYVTEHVEALEIDPSNTKIYICGNGTMVREVKNIAVAKGLAKEDIHLEQYSAA